MKLPAVLPADAVTAIRDTREQVGLDLSPLPTIVGGLPTGDYSVVGLEHHIAIELKGNLSDLLACVGRERERFDREMHRMRGYPVRALVLCTTWGEIEAGDWRGKVTVSAVEGSIAGWVAMGIPCLLVGNRERAARVVRRILYTAAKRRYRECRTLLQQEKKT